MQDFNTKLQKEKRDLYKNAIIISESVFSMDGDIADIKKLVELKKATPLDILKINPLPDTHSIEVIVEPSKVLNYKAFFTSLGFNILSIRTVSTARPILHGIKTVDEILPAITGILPDDVETE